MITASGLICDICGEYILFDGYHVFDLIGVDRYLHCHATRCKPLLEAARDDWHKLPDGPLRQAFEDAAEQDAATWREYTKTVLGAAGIAIFCGLLCGGLAFIFTTRLASMRIGGWITAATFIIVMLVQGAHDDRRD